MQGQGHGGHALKELFLVFSISNTSERGLAGWVQKWPSRARGFWGHSQMLVDHFFTLESLSGLRGIGLVGTSRTTRCFSRGLGGLVLYDIALLWGRGLMAPSTGAGLAGWPGNGAPSTPFSVEVDLREHPADIWEWAVPVVWERWDCPAAGKFSSAVTAGGWGSWVPPMVAGVWDCPTELSREYIPFSNA